MKITCIVSYLAPLVDVYERFSLSFQTVTNTSLSVVGQFQTFQVLQKAFRMKKKICDLQLPLFSGTLCALWEELLTRFCRLLA